MSFGGRCGFNSRLTSTSNYKRWNRHATGKIRHKMRRLANLLQMRRLCLEIQAESTKTAPILYHMAATKAWRTCWVSTATTTRAAKLKRGGDA